VANTTKIKIRHALAFYLDENGHQYTAFRNQKVEVPTKEAERLKTLGAAVDVDDELPMVGRITPIPNTASDEELISWVSVATTSEIVEAVAEQPELKDRILAARDVVKKRLEAQDELLSGIDKTLKAGTALARKRKNASKKGAPTTGADGRNVNAVIPDDEVDDEVDDDDEVEDEEPDYPADDPRMVVRGNVGEVAGFLAENPDKAQDVLEAEKAEALDKQREVRPGVVKAVAAAVNATNQ
jgi:hypothetical protein